MLKKMLTIPATSITSNLRFWLMPFEAAVVPKATAPALETGAAALGLCAMYRQMSGWGHGTKASKLKNQIRNSCPEARCPNVQWHTVTCQQPIQMRPGCAARQ